MYKTARRDPTDFFGRFVFINDFSVNEGVYIGRFGYLIPYCFLYNAEVYTSKYYFVLGISNPGREVGNLLYIFSGDQP